MVDLHIPKTIFAVTIFLSMTAAAGHACTTCAESIELNKRQLACVETFMPVYLADPADPVIVSLLECGRPAADYTTSDARSDPVINPIVDPKGDKQAADKVYFLTKKQIRCLQENMSELKQQDGQPVVFQFSRCKN